MGSLSAAAAAHKQRAERWSPAAIDARAEARGRLAAALHLLAFRSARAESPDDTLAGMRHGPWLMRRRRVIECGHAAVAYAQPSPSAAPVPVVGPSGVPVSLVSHCGSRIGCPDCASRVASRNTRRLADALKDVYDAERRAAACTLALAWWRKAHDAENALDVILSATGRRDLRVRPQLGAHGVDLVGPVDAVGFFSSVRDTLARRELPADLMPDAPPTRVALDLMPMIAAAKWESARARRRAERAEIQQERLRHMVDAERELAAAAAAVRAAERVPVVDDSTDPVPGLHTRDAERWPSILARAHACHDSRALRAYERLRAGALARLERRRQREIDRAMRRHALAVRRHVEARRGLALSRTVRRADLRFVTLTQQRRDGESASAALARLSSALRRLASRKEWRHICAGAVWKVECEWSTPDTRRAIAQQQQRQHDALKNKTSRKATRLADSIARLSSSSSWSSSGAGWHAHAHLITSTGDVPHKRLRAMWQAASASLDVGAWIERPRAGIHKELAKYISKPLATRTMRVDVVADLIAGIERRRLCWTTGGMRRARLVEADRMPSATVEGADVGSVVGVAGTRPITRAELRGASFADEAQGELPGFTYAEGAPRRRQLAPTTSRAADVTLAELVGPQAAAVCWRSVVWRDDVDAVEARIGALRTIDRRRQPPTSTANVESLALLA